MDPNQRYPYYRHQQEEEYPEEDEYGYDYQDPSHQRPSFESYWKRSKEEDMSASSSGPRNIRFVETSIPATTSSGGYGYGSTSTAGGGYGSSSGYGSGSGMDAGVGPMDAGYGPGPGSVTSAGGTEGEFLFQSNLATNT
ncbi:hypothetical protein B0H66DRAFT_526739 [Apodospora peruviana]|uniref:Uncharacterized protein n=1 Tax=Apodospora peruviana TaxID=516989 RepID=A0AAE0IQU4_9PEZI|nr:hypothetical protein B0H66DRAFT_526739 [Apodospora peruviana]